MVWSSKNRSLRKKHAKEELKEIQTEHDILDKKMQETNSDKTRERLEELKNCLKVSSTTTSRKKQIKSVCSCTQTLKNKLNGF